MATQRLMIVKYHEKTQPKHPDGQIKAKDNGIVGAAWNKQGPDEKYIDCVLKGHWIVTEEEKKLLDKAKRDEREGTNPATAT